VIDLRCGPRAAPRKQMILELAKERGVICCRDLQEAMGLTKNNAALVLWNMYRANLLNRTGDKGRYRYTA